jgi:hypothetical protein
MAPSLLGLASSQRPLENIQTRSEDCSQARGGEEVLVLASLSQAPECLISQKWPLYGSWGLRWKEVGPRSRRGWEMINSEATNIKTKAI